jgi:uncharacterized protein (DUF2141 family)
MRNGMIPQLITAFSLLFATPAVADSPDNVSLEVEVSGVRHSRGRVGCLLFSSERGFPKDASRASQRAWVKAEAGKVAVCSFSAVAKGSYAVAVMHDENGNGELDSNFVGAPVEGYGFSNGARSGMFGPPAFAKARLALISPARWTVPMVYP